MFIFTDIANRIVRFKIVVLRKIFEPQQQSKININVIRIILYIYIYIYIYIILYYIYINRYNFFYSYVMIFIKTLHKSARKNIIKAAATFKYARYRDV